MNSRRRRMLVAATTALALVLGPRLAVAQDQGPRELPTSTFGNWSLSATSDRGLQIANRLRPAAVRLRLTHGSNGWFWLETQQAQYIMWSAGNFSHQSFTFDDEKPDASAPALPSGSYIFGTWSIRVVGDELHLDHPDNPHRIILTRSADGFIRISGVNLRGDMTIRPDEQIQVNGD